MGSGRFEYSLVEKAALFSQFASVMKIAHNQERPAARISLALQAAVSDDDIIVIPKVIQTPTGKVFHVTGNARTATDAINALDCPVKQGLAGTPAKIPMILQPVDCKVRAVPLGMVISTEEVYSLYPKILTPAEFFAFGAKFPEEQRKASHFTIWLDAKGRFWRAVLGADVGRRGVEVYLANPDVLWHVRYRVLVRE
jgi:hypothetical protein